MMNDQESQHYTPLLKYLHWLVAALILIQYLLIELAEHAAHSSQVVKQLGLIANHKSVGITILLIATFRLIYRFSSKQPTQLSAMPDWQIKASHASHALLYLMLFALPISGWLMSSASAYSVSWFNLLALPDFISPNEQTADLLATVHFTLAKALILIAALHIGAAIKHHVVDQDTILVRILSQGSVASALIVLIISMLVLGGLLPKKTTTEKQTPNSTTEFSEHSQAEEAAFSGTQSTLPVWRIDYAKSYINFTGKQAGAPFTGVWQHWEGKLQFSHAKLEQSRFNVKIDISSVFSNDGERDSTIKSADFFDALQFPYAHFQANDFNATDTGYVAQGFLTMKGLKQPTTLSFALEQKGPNVTLIGKAKLTRHQWDIGVGDWADPTWVGSDVIVDVKVVAINTE